MAKSSKKPTKLNQALVLFQYMLEQFNVRDLDELAGQGEMKRPQYEELTDTNTTLFCDYLCDRPLPHGLTPAMLREYDEHIVAHTQYISENRGERLKWKYFQYMVLLFTEIYLDRWFRDADAFLKDLNTYREGFNQGDATLFSGHHRPRAGDFQVEPFTEDDLRKLAFWSATGSGKTLLMHVHLLQYLHYAEKHGRKEELNNIILLTPNEGLSAQHLKEFKASGIEAALFKKNRMGTVGTLGVFQKHEVQILDIHKLAETSGDKTVAVTAFEANNLVLIDEGHRGAKSVNDTGWKVMRDMLSAEGFSFEYSATFGQAVSSATGSQRQRLLQEYAKSTLFDYSYYHFYTDGYGKDYNILNLDDTWEEQTLNLYLTACLLRFFQQMMVHGENANAIALFGTEKPLCIFVGGKVTAVRKVHGKEVSDVVYILQFLQQFVRNKEDAVRALDNLLNNTSGLVDGGHRSIFQNSFTAVVEKRITAEDLYSQMLSDLFNSTFAGAELHLDNLKGAKGEIGLRLGTADYFGVINVGDDSKLMKLCEANGLSTAERDFSESLFHNISRKDSTVNILIGSKKFSEGWSSWRVSTMGLMNIGQGEGSEIIQLFGRGVRLKGYQHSLKRSNRLDPLQRPEQFPNHLKELETLNIFGIRANYMQQFKTYLEEAGLPANDGSRETIEVPAMLAIDLGDKPLKVLKVKAGADFKKATSFELPMAEDFAGHKVVVDWYPKVQLVQSAQGNASGVTDLETGVLTATHTAFFNWDKLYTALQRFKNERGWSNLGLPREALQALFAHDHWYTLYVPAHQLEFSGFEQVFLWQEMALALLKGYVERCYNRVKNKYLSRHLEVETLTKEHPNFIDSYTFKVDVSETTLIEKLKQLATLMESQEFKEDFTIGAAAKAICFANHLYQPLVYFNAKRYKEILEVAPVQLNEGERDFVNDLRTYVESEPEELKGKELYLLRNISRKGTAFFEASAFYPDFILWLIDPSGGRAGGDKQYVNFIDPKGLRQIEGFEHEKISLHKRIREEIEPILNDPNMVLNSFIVSTTPYRELKHWKGQNSVADFEKQHVFFRESGYLGRMVGRVM